MAQEVKILWLFLLIMRSWDVAMVVAAISTRHKKFILMALQAATAAASRFVFIL